MNWEKLFGSIFVALIIMIIICAIGFSAAFITVYFGPLVSLVILGGIVFVALVVGFYNGED